LISGTLADTIPGIHRKICQIGCGFLVMMIVRSSGAGFGLERPQLIGIGFDERADDNATNEHH
jgi:hypothetical protein